MPYRSLGDSSCATKRIASVFVSATERSISISCAIETIPMSSLPDFAHKSAVAHSDPLFLSGPFLTSGHNSEIANGTVTYIKFKNRLFGVTCAHIYDQQFSNGQDRCLTVHGKNRTVYQFGTYSSSGYRSHFVSLRSADHLAPDIAIASIGQPLPEIHMAPKGKRPIDLDAWMEPDWSDIGNPVAFGFPTEHKAVSGDNVQSPFLAVVAEPASQLSTASNTFLIASSLERANDYYFSGMSGGAVYAAMDDPFRLVPIGIVFEGSPGSSEEWINRDEQSFFTRDDVQIRAYLLTPRIFEEWLSMAFGSCA